MLVSWLHTKSRLCESMHISLINEFANGCFLVVKLPLSSTSVYLQCFNQKLKRGHKASREVFGDQESRHAAVATTGVRVKLSSPSASLSAPQREAVWAAGAVLGRDREGTVCFAVWHSLSSRTREGGACRPIVILCFTSMTISAVLNTADSCYPREQCFSISR